MYGYNKYETHTQHVLITFDYYTDKMIRSFWEYFWLVSCVTQDWCCYSNHVLHLQQTLRLTRDERLLVVSRQIFQPPTNHKSTLPNPLSHGSHLITVNQSQVSPVKSHNPTFHLHHHSSLEPVCLYCDLKDPRAECNESLWEFLRWKLS